MWFWWPPRFESNGCTWLSFWYLNTLVVGNSSPLKAPHSAGDTFLDRGQTCLPQTPTSTPWRPRRTLQISFSYESYSDIADSCYIPAEHSLLLHKMAIFSHGGKSMDELTLLICNIKNELQGPHTLTLLWHLKSQKNDNVEALEDKRYQMGDGCAPALHQAWLRLHRGQSLLQILSTDGCGQNMKVNLGFGFSQAHLGVGYMDVHIAKISLWFTKVCV